MLYYTLDNEILMDIYKAYLSEEKHTVHSVKTIGQQFQPLIERYPLEERTCNVIMKMVNIKDQEELAAVDNAVIHGYLTAKTMRRAEEKAFDQFIEGFDEDTRFVLKKFRKHVMGQKVIPYKIKNRVFHIDVSDTPALVMALDFDNVLIEDGRHPREILITHLYGETDTRDVEIEQEGGEKTIVKVPVFRLHFINALTEEPYQTRESILSFTSVKGTCRLYDYGTYMPDIQPKDEKLPWRMVMNGLQALIGKVQMLGTDPLTEDEKEDLQMLCVMYELLYFYLDEKTIPGIAGVRMQYDHELAQSFAFSRQELAVAFEGLKTYLPGEMLRIRDSAHDNRHFFCQQWITFLANASSERLFLGLMKVLKALGKAYDPHPVCLPYRKYHVIVKDRVGKLMASKGWEGTFPDYYKPSRTGFVEVTNVYERQYTYLGCPKHVHYCHLAEYTDADAYSLSFIKGSVLFNKQRMEKEKDYTALSGYFSDGGRRKACITAELSITEAMSCDDIDDLLAEIGNKGDWLDIV